MAAGRGATGWTATRRRARPTTTRSGAGTTSGDREEGRGGEGGAERRSWATGSASVQRGGRRGELCQAGGEGRAGELASWTSWEGELVGRSEVMTGGLRSQLCSEEQGGWAGRTAAPAGFQRGHAEDATPLHLDLAPLTTISGHHTCPPFYSCPPRLHQRSAGRAEFPAATSRGAGLASWPARALRAQAAPSSFPPSARRPLLASSSHRLRWARASGARPAGPRCVHGERALVGPGGPHRLRVSSRQLVLGPGHRPRPRPPLPPPVVL